MRNKLLADYCGGVGMKSKLFIVCLVLIVIGITVTGFFILKLSGTFYTNEVEKRLLDNTSLIKHRILQQLGSGDTPDYSLASKTYSRILNGYPDKNKNGAAIAFLDLDGSLLNGPETGLLTEDFLNRPEIQKAIAGSTATDIRKNRMYAAVPVTGENLIISVSVPLQLIEINRKVFIYAGLGMLAGLLLTILLAMKFSFSITHPVNQLMSLSKEISSGNYSKRVFVKSRDELGRLSHTFNEMAYTLEKTVNDLQDKNVKLDTIMNSMVNGIIAVDSNSRVIMINSIACELFNITEQDVVGLNFTEVIRNVRINRLLDKTMQNAKPFSDEITTSMPDERILSIHTTPMKSNNGFGEYAGGIVSVHDITNIKKLEHIRTEFVSNVTHELKTPLTSIRGFVETLRNGAVKDPDIAERFLEIIDIEAERLYTLISDIMQLSEIETKQKDSNIGKHNLKAIVEETISILAPSAQSKKIDIELDIGENIEITANSNRIKQMLINLIDNAIKYNRESGYVLVSAYKSEGSINVMVKDNGIGIPEQHQARIFERFYRVDKGRSRDMGGTGLGLSIVKHIVNLYNGNIRVSSASGEGTEFIIQLPS